VFDNNNSFSSKLIEQVSEYYTTDVNFLTDTQTLIQTYKKIDYPSKNYNNIISIWNEIKNDTAFKEKYYYIDWPMLEFLNKSDQFLQIMSVYNLSSPVISFFVPIIILIIPFFVIKLKGLTITMSEYCVVLKEIIKKNAIGRLFTEFNEVELNQKIYLLISAAFYVFSIYQNVMVCIRFNHNMVKIHNHFNEIREYLNHTIRNMNNYLKYSNALPSHAVFNDVVNTKMNVLIEFKNKIEFISEYKFSFQKVFEIGKILKYFYELYDSTIYNDAFLYSFGFNGYVDCLEGLITNVEERKICFAEFIQPNDKKTKNEFKNNYYAVLKNENPVKNNIKLNKNIIITGPNASGKTTILKSTLINIILTQQFGCGFYDSAKLKPFKYVHCYLNIPDTSGRDSLFQAEARRCKDILNIVDSNKADTHFCAFDELYSGTNPDEAVVSAISFMEYLVKNKNISCILTTHFTKICKKLKKNKQVMNCHMDVIKENNKITYNYLLKEGISEVKGGINVLSDMNYPTEIIENTIKHLN
jgi:hypothetical protein